MKSCFLTCLAFLCLALKTFAQTGACDVYFSTVEFISAKPSASVSGKYDVRINLTWEQDANNGNKYTYFHIWQAANYVSFDYTNPAPQNAPKASNLSTTIGTIVIKSPASNSPDFYATYNPDATYIKLLGLAGTGAVLKTQDLTGKRIRFTVENLLLPGVTPDPNNIYNFVGDIWSSQQSDGKNVHCSTKGNRLVANNAINRSTIACTSAKVQVKIQSTTAAISGTYQVYVDNNSAGKFDESTDTKLGSELPFTTSVTASTTGAWPYNYVASDIAIPSQYKGYNLWVVISPTGQSSQVFSLLNPCATLAVLFTSFQANRDKQTVTLKWQTAAEQNAASFFVQRQTTGDWITVASLPAKNSASGATYEAIDANAYKGLNQYRIVEQDMDGTQWISEIRSVQGEGTATKLTVYPNPSSTGKVNLVFGNNAIRDIAVVDMSGRIVKQLRGESGSNVVFELLQDGFYQVQITDRTTGEIIAEKLIIKKR